MTEKYKDLLYSKYEVLCHYEMKAFDWNWLLFEDHLRSIKFVNQPLDVVQKIVLDKSDVLNHNYQTLLNLKQLELKALLHDSHS